VIEAMNPEGELFGKERLMAALAEERQMAMPALVKHVRRAVTQFVASAAQTDDITMLAAQVG